MSLVRDALRLALMGFKVFPLIPGTKRPLIRQFTDAATTDDETIRLWWQRNPSANIGIASSRFGDDGDALLVIDVDNKNGKSGSDALKRLELEKGPLHPTFTQTTPTGGLHIVFRVPQALTQGVNVLGIGLDTRSGGGYIVGSGSLIDGVAYTDNGAEIADCPDWLAGMMRPWSPATSPAPAVPAAAEQDADESGVDYLAAADLVREADPPEQGSRNDSAFRLACKVRDYGLSREQCLALLEPWSSRGDALEDAELAAAVNSAYTYAKSPSGSRSVADVAKVFVAAERETSPGEDGYESLADTQFETETPSDPTSNLVERLNKDFAFVVVGGGHHILWETTDAEGRPRIEHLSEGSFHKMLAAKKITVDIKAKPRPWTDIWMEHPARRSYAGIVFDPSNKAPARFFNHWKGFPVVESAQSSDAEWALAAYLRHLDENVCAGNKTLARWLTGYLAHIIQKPWEKPHVALVFRGRKGTGKTILFELLRGILGRHFFLTAHPRYVTGQFNSHLEQCLLFVLDEALWSGDKIGEGVLKHLVTGATHQVEHKGKASYEVKNLTRVVVIGNEKWLVPATTDERRFAVFDVADNNRLDMNFFGRMKDGMENGGYRLLFDYLMAFDLQSINPHVAPMTEALADQKRLSLPLVLQWLGDSLAHGAPMMATLPEDGWPEEMPVSSVIRALREYAATRNARERLPSAEDTVELLAAVDKSFRAIRSRVDASRSRVLLFPPIDAAKESWASYLGSVQAPINHEEGW